MMRRKCVARPQIIGRVVGVRSRSWQAAVYPSSCAYKIREMQRQFWLKSKMIYCPTDGVAMVVKVDICQEDLL